MVQKNPPIGHLPCPACDMGMIVVDGYGLDPKRQTFECLRCGHIDQPAENPRRQAAEQGRLNWRPLSSTKQSAGSEGSGPAHFDP